MFHFIGELSKILFGAMDEDDSNYYNEQIKLFEQNSEDTNTLLNQQLSVVRSSLGAVNSTLTDVEYNENLLKEGINRITKCMNDRLCGLVVRVSGYRYRGPGFDPRRYQIF